MREEEGEAREKWQSANDVFSATSETKVESKRASFHPIIAGAVNCSDTFVETGLHLAEISREHIGPAHQVKTGIAAFPTLLARVNHGRRLTPDNGRGEQESCEESSERCCHVSSRLD